MPKIKAGHFMLGAILVCSFFLRLSGINWGFIFDQKSKYITSVHDDERRELRAIGQMHPKKLDFNPDDAQREGPLHPYIVSAALFVSSQLGIVQLSPDENFYRRHPMEMKKLFLVGRMVSVLFGVLEVFLVYLIGKRFFSSGVGLLGAAFMAVLPLEVVQSTYFRSYTLANVLLLSILYAALGIGKGEMRSAWPRRIGALLAGFAFSTRIIMAPAVLLLPTAEIYVKRTEEQNWRAVLLAAARTFFTSTVWWCMLGVVITNPTLVSAPLEVWRGMTAQLGYGGSFFDAASRIKNFLPLLHSLVSGVTAPIVLLAGIGAVIAMRSHNAFYHFLRLAAAFAIPYGYAAFGSSYAAIPRFTMPFTPFAALLAAYAITKFLPSAQPKTHFLKLKSIGVAIGVAGILLYPALYGIAYARAARQPHSLERLSQWIEKNISPESSIGITLKHAHFKDIDFQKYKNVVELDNTLAGLETRAPDYLILFPYICCDFYAGPPPQEVYEPQLQRYHYKEIQRFRGKIPPVWGIPFSHRIDRQLEYESRVYRKL